LAAREFLIQALGFEQVVWHDDPTTGEVHHAELQAPGGGVVSLHSGVDGSSIADLVGRASGGGYPPFGMHLDIEDPDAAYARAVAAGATVVRELQDRFTGTRGFIVADPEGMYWSVSTPLPPMERDENGQWQPAAAT
jgi:uncharacterized glyoxalase superfamily protein PhnB